MGTGPDQMRTGPAKNSSVAALRLVALRAPMCLGFVLVACTHIESVPDHWRFPARAPTEAPVWMLRKKCMHQHRARHSGHSSRP